VTDHRHEETKQNRSSHHHRRCSSVGWKELNWTRESILILALRQADLL